MKIDISKFKKKQGPVLATKHCGGGGCGGGCRRRRGCGNKY